MNFNPDFSNDEENNEDKKQEIEMASPSSVVVKETNDVLSMSTLLNVTLTHMEDSKKVRDEINDLTDILNNSIPIMSIKEMLEYLKVKIKENEFHVDCVFKAFNFVQRTELAKEMLLGSERKERIIEAIDRTKVNNLVSLFNAPKPLKD